MTTVISVENLSKHYILSHLRKERYTALRDVIAEGVKRLFSRNASANDLTHEEFWALRDISFDIQQGDRVGIIGRNGAGKSTLLKVLSRITEPTTGSIKIKGRVASLLEVGTGFHPELTGRENIYLNGAILGMTKMEIRKKFDEIIAFAEVEKFLDTPVKRYSSGMYVRLAFAVAAHLEPEILVVDEVLAVGDAQFQKKCLGKMEDVSKEGRTVLFVSHNMSTIQKLCNSGILLKGGKIADSGPIASVIESYLGDVQPSSEGNVGELSRSRHDFGSIVRIVGAYPVNAKGERVSSFMIGEEIAFNLEIKASEKINDLSVVVGLDTYMDYRITTVLSEESGVLFSADKDAVISINVALPGLHLKNGIYALTLGIRRNKVAMDHVIKAINFEINEASMGGKERDPAKLGDLMVEAKWESYKEKH